MMVGVGWGDVQGRQSSANNAALPIRQGDSSTSVAASV